MLAGNGLPATWPNTNFVLTIVSGTTVIAPNVFSADPSALTLLLPPSSNSYTITITPPSGSKIVQTITVSSSNTPNLTLSSASTISAGNSSFTFTKNNLQTATPQYVEIYSLFNANELYNVSIPAQATNTSVVFSSLLPGGLFGFRFFYSSYGYASCSSQLTVTISQPSIPNFVSSYNGGSISLTGSGLSPSATISVNGFNGKLSNITSNNAIASIPPFVSSLTQNHYSLVTPQKITSHQFTVISDTQSSGSNPFDGLQSTVYNSSSASTCFVGIDVGSELSLNLTRIRYFPNGKWLIAANYLIGATFEASKDGTNYD